MEHREFVVSSTKAKDVEPRCKSIGDMFKVLVTFTSDPSTASRTGNTWLKIAGSTKESTEMAEEYVKSFCNAEHEQILVITPSFHRHLQTDGSKNLDKYRRTSGAVIVLLSETELLLQGTRSAVKRAENQVEIALQQNKIPSAAKDYVKKLGYTDEEIWQAAIKCESNVTENTLLQELLISSAKRGLSINSNGLSDPDNNKHLPSDIALVRLEEPADSYLGQLTTRNAMIGDGQFTTQDDESDDLRSIVIDGSNVAMCHGNKAMFSCLGIKICVNYFKSRGHRNITVFVPQWRKEACTQENPIQNQEILLELEREQIVVFTPSRRVNGRRVICYDDRYIVKLAAAKDGVIVSNDNFRDLGKENPHWKQVIDQRLLMYSFVNNMFMPPDDPLGRHGPSLDDFLRKGASSQPKPCPYGKKCTYGLKCRFGHPERQTTHSSLSVDDDIVRSASCPSSGTASPSLPDLQPRRHSFSRPSPYSSCATEYNSMSSFSTGYGNSDILARGSPVAQRGASQRGDHQFSPDMSSSPHHKGNNMQPSPALSYGHPAEQPEYATQYVQGMQGSPVLFYPTLYDPHVPGQYMGNQGYMPAYQLPPQQYGHRVQGYPVHGNQQYLYADQQRQQQHFFPQDMIGCAPPPNMMNRVELEMHGGRSTTGEQPSPSVKQTWVNMLERLEEIFPNKRHCILRVMKEHPTETDVSALAQFILAAEE